MSMTMWPSASRPSSRMSGVARASARVRGTEAAGRATAGEDGSGVIGPYATPARPPHPALSPQGERDGGKLDAEGVEARDIPSHDQRVNVVRPLVSVDRFEIHHVTDDRMLVDDAGGTQDVARHPSAV